MQHYPAEAMGRPAPDLDAPGATPSVGVDARAAAEMLSTIQELTRSRAADEKQVAGAGGPGRTQVEFEDLVELMQAPAGRGPVSIGSIGHRQGACTPCAFWARGLCSMGILCRYCHILHPQHKRLSKLRRARQRARKLPDPSAVPEVPQVYVWSEDGETTDFIMSL